MKTLSVFTILLTLLMLAFTSSAYAQLGLGQESEADRFLREQQLRREKDELQRQESIPIQDQTEPQPETLADKICFTIKDISIQGATVISAESLAELSDPLLGECVGQKSIAKFIQAINQMYIERGYITTRAYLPEQNLSQGNLVVKIIEGTIESIKLNENSRSDSIRLWAALPGSKVGDVLNMRNLEQTVDQLDAPPSTKSNVKLWPGNEVGSTLVEISTVDNNSFRANITTDNDGQDSSGKNRLTLGLEYDNLLSLNETFRLSYIGSRDTNALIFQTGFSFGNASISMTKSYSEYISFLSEYSELFGSSDSNYLNFDYMLFRNAKHKITVKSGLSKRESQRLINDVELSPQRLAVATLGIEHRYVNGQSRWLNSIKVSNGLNAFGASVDLDNLPQDAPHAQFQKISGNIHFSRPINDKLYLQSLFSGQYAFDSLYGSEQIHLGGLSSVRGFIGQPISGDEGYYLRNDVSLSSLNRSLSEKLSWLDVSSSVFVDIGYVKSRAENIYGRYEESLAGAGCAINLFYRASRASITLAVPVFASQKRIMDGYQLSFSLNLSF